MAATTIMAYGSKIIHLGNSDGNTRCGRRLSSFTDSAITPGPGFRNCARCGTQDDFDAVLEEARLRYQRARDEQNARIEAARRRALKRREIVCEQIVPLLESALASVGHTSVETFRSGQFDRINITVKREGEEYNFKLTQVMR